MSCSQPPNHRFYVYCTGIEPSHPGPSTVRRKLQAIGPLAVLLWELLAPRTASKLSLILWAPRQPNSISTLEPPKTHFAVTFNVRTITNNKSAAILGICLLSECENLLLKLIFLAVIFYFMPAEYTRLPLYTRLSYPHPLAKLRHTIISIHVPCIFYYPVQ